VVACEGEAMLNLTELTSRVHHHGYARGVVVMDPSDYDVLLYEIETLRERLNDLQESASAGLRRAKVEEYKELKDEELVGKFFASRHPSHVVRIVDWIVIENFPGERRDRMERTFLVAYHHPDGRKRYSNSELTYAELAERYDLGRSLTFPWSPVEKQ
jgi:hypothetical protein